MYSRCVSHHVAYGTCDGLVLQDSVTGGCLSLMGFSPGVPKGCRGLLLSFLFFGGEEPDFGVLKGELGGEDDGASLIEADHLA